MCGNSSPGRTEPTSRAQPTGAVTSAVETGWGADVAPDPEPDPEPDCEPGSEPGAGVASPAGAGLPVGDCVVDPLGGSVCGLVVAGVSVAGGGEAVTCGGAAPVDDPVGVPVGSSPVAVGEEVGTADVVGVGGGATRAQ